MEEKERQLEVNQSPQSELIPPEYQNGYVVSIAFFDNGRPYYFYSDSADLMIGTKVVVDTVRGLELGEVVKAPLPIQEVKLRFPLKPLVRVATPADIAAFESNKIQSIQALSVCKEAVERLALDMRLLRADYTLDGSKIIIIYIAENRVDFRELLKELASKLRCRIELRQIGTRDRSKIVGGIGVCGLPFCCSTFLEEFDGISINMAKNQFLALNIQKLSGACGKLICCLKYENDQYSEIRRGLPKIGLKIQFDNDTYKITSINILTHQVRLENSDTIRMAPLAQVMEIVNNQKQ